MKQKIINVLASELYFDGMKVGKLKEVVKDMEHISDEAVLLYNIGGYFDVVEDRDETDEEYAARLVRQEAKKKESDLNEYSRLQARLLKLKNELGI